MKQAGAELVMHYNEMAFMGFWEVIKNIFKIRSLLKTCKADILSSNPDVLILIDYPGFNLRLARFASENGIRVFYYISPKIWAWNQKRAYKIKKYVERMFVILPFEKEFYQKFDYAVDYVGNPLMDSINSFTIDTEFRVKQDLNTRPVIAVLPGSRKQEIHFMLKSMIEIASDFPEYQFVVAAVNNLEKSFYSAAIETPNIKVVYDCTYDLLGVSQAALVTSGTAALETALLNVPQVVCYKTSWLSYTLAKLLIKVKYISLVNLIANKEVVKELIQDDFNPENIKRELKLIIKDGTKRLQQLQDYSELKSKLSQLSPSEKTAKLIKSYLDS